MLQGVVQRGTAAAASVAGPPAGGKTGTTNEYRSRLVRGLHAATGGRRSTSASTTTAAWARARPARRPPLPIFIDFMQEANKGYAAG